MRLWETYGKEGVSGKDATWTRKTSHMERQPESKISLLKLQGSITGIVTGSRNAKVKTNEETG